MCRLYLVNFVDMWDLKACHGKILRNTLSEIEFKSNFSSISQHLKSTEYSNYLVSKKVWGLDSLRLNVKAISAVFNILLEHLIFCNVTVLESIAMMSESTYQIYVIPIGGLPCYYKPFLSCAQMEYHFFHQLNYPPHLWYPASVKK